jgi:polar amino acid transport system permease protein
VIQAPGSRPVRRALPADPPASGGGEALEQFISLLSFGPDGWGDELASGAWLTIRLAVATVPFGLVVGFLVAYARRSESKALRIPANAFTTVFRGLPELLTIFIVYYGGQVLLQKVVSLFADTQVTVSSFVAGMVALGLVFAAYASEVFLGAFRNIPRGHYDAAHALGLRTVPTLYLVILPQFVRLALPGVANLWLILLKDTSLVSVIALSDLMRQTYVAVGATKQPFPFYLTACLIYLAMSIVSSFGITGIERWSERGVRTVR